MFSKPDGHISRPLDVGRVPSLKYRIAYEIQDQWVFIDADPKRKEAYSAKTISKEAHPEPYPVGAVFR